IAEDAEQRLTDHVRRRPKVGLHTEVDLAPPQGAGHDACLRAHATLRLVPCPSSLLFRPAEPGQARFREPQRARKSEPGACATGRFPSSGASRFGLARFLKLFPRRATPRAAVAPPLPGRSAPEASRAA